MKSWFRCTHKKTSLPITRRRKDKKEVEINRQANTYVVCLNCGEQIPYSFSESRVVEERRKASEEGGPAPRFHSLA
jgi:hypothetical protein